MYVETKSPGESQLTDPHSLVSLIAWLEKQPGETRYDYCDPEKCLLGQYLQAMGVKEFAIGDPSNLFDGHAGDILQGPNGDYRRTFGAALERARALAG